MAIIILPALFVLGLVAFILYPFAQRRRRLRRVLIALGILGSLSGCLLIILFGLLESVCPWDPWIDTCRAPGFSELKFKQVGVGMTKAEVLALLGEPLEDRRPGFAGESERWRYTSDGGCWWWDFAWNCREVIFSGDVVMGVESETYRD